MSNPLQVQRRSFLAASGGAAAAVAGLGTSALDAATGGSALDRAEHTQFEGLVGQRFVVRDNKNRTNELVLKEVVVHDTPADDRPSHVRQQGFSLIFAGREGSEIDNATQLVAHRDLGQLPLLLQQTHSENPCVLEYEAVFN